MSWSDYNFAQRPPAFELIARGTLARLRMTIQPGGYDDAARGWTGGYATLSAETGAVYLACAFVVLGGHYARRKLWSHIGLYSRHGDAWANRGRSLVRAMLNSARGLLPDDTRPEAVAARRIAGFAELDGLEFAARIDVESTPRGELRNVVRHAIEPDHNLYFELMGRGAAAVTASSSVAPTSPGPTVGPTWVQ